MSIMSGMDPRYFSYPLMSGNSPLIFSGSATLPYAHFQSATPFTAHPTSMSYRIDDTEVKSLLLFLIEMLATPTEKGLFFSLKENPQDAATRAAYIDFLLENGRKEAAGMLTKNWTRGI